MRNRLISGQPPRLPSAATVMSRNPALHPSGQRQGAVKNSPSMAIFSLEGNIKTLLSETVNYGSNAAVLFDVELKDGSFQRINVEKLFTDREFIGNCSRELYGHLCHRKGYMMRG
jgi:hypothetical protein